MMKPGKTTIGMHVTEHRTVGELAQAAEAYRARNTVRVFFEGDSYYGMWCPEDFLYSFLTEEQKTQYRDDASYTGGKFEISLEAARQIVEKSMVPPGVRKIKL